jgi:hypothetical protein
MGTVDLINKTPKNIFGHAELVWRSIPWNVPRADHGFIPPRDEEQDLRESAIVGLTRQPYRDIATRLDPR